MNSLGFFSYSLQDWQHFFAEIYGERNLERFGPTPYQGVSRMWLNLVEDMTFIAKSIRKNDMNMLIVKIPHLLCWFCGVATKARIDLDDLVWHYFPFVCPTCWQPVCVCGVEKKVAKLAAQKDEVTLAAMRTKNAARQPRVLDDYVQMFSAIYGSHSDSATLVDIYLHFSEEVGEVAHHIREVEAASGAGGNPAGVIELALRSELADVFSWVCKLCWRIDRNLQGFLPWAQYHLPITTADLFQIRFSEIIYHEYEMGCPSCHSRPCLIDCRSWHERQGADSSGKLGTKE